MEREKNKRSGREEGRLVFSGELAHRAVWGIVSKSDPDVRGARCPSHAEPEANEENGT